ncbi:MAG: peptidase C39 [Treponema sp. CETP13]|nr:MAG: peptidase C39 [Treponema sp. CETP13]
MKIQKVLQHDETDCGVACLSIIFKYYGKTVSLRKIRTVAGTDKKGTSGLGIVKGANSFGMSCKCLMATDKEKISEIALPAIFHFHGNTDHYIVVYKIKNKKIYVSDPALGLYKISKKTFFEKWSGVFFLLYPNTSFEKGSDKRGMFFRFFTLLKPHKKMVCKIVISSLLLSFFGVFMSFYFRFLIDEVLYSEIKSTLNLCSLCYLMVIIFQTIITFCRSQIILYLGEKIDVVLLCDFFCHLLFLPLSFFTSRKTGEILSRLDDTETIRGAVSSTSLSVVLDSFMIVIGGYFLFKMGSKLLPVAMIPVFVSALVVWICTKPFKLLIRKRAVLAAEKNATLYESVNGIATIKGLATEKKAFSRAEVRIVETAEKTLSLGKLGNIQKSLQTLISGCGTLALYWYGSYLIFGGFMTLGQLISFVTLSGFFLSPLSRLLTMQSYWQEVLVSAERLSDIIDLEEETKDEENKRTVDTLNGDIQFKDVSFSYGTRGKAIHDVSFTISKGQRVAFVGMSGSGKTTLLKLLMRFYPCDEGNILIHNTDITEYKTDSYRENIGYVPQESLLFSGTISENIAWGSPVATKEKIIKAAHDAQAYDFIMNLPDKFNTNVGEQGTTLSGGERQRIALARILMRDPSLLILDEATASLDSISEHAIMDTVFNKIKNRTIIMVAHRLSSICSCENIFVFEKGKLMESGSHEKLLNKKGKYYELWRAQNEKSYCSTSSE